MDYEVLMKNIDYIAFLALMRDTFLNTRDTEILLFRTVALAKMQYFTRKFHNCQKDIRKTWRSINDILKPKSRKKTCSNICKSGKVISRASEVSEGFNEFFSIIGSELDGKVPPSNTSPLTYLTH